MELNEKITTIIDKTGVTEAEAWAALEQNGGDILDAVLSLERAGKIKKEEPVEDKTIERLEGDVVNRDGSRAENTSEKALRFADSVKNLVIALSKQMFEVERKGEEILSIPVLVLIILLIVGFGVLIPLMIVGLFLGCHYHFSGAKTMTFDVNELSRKASEYAEDIKTEFRINRA